MKTPKLLLTCAILCGMTVIPAFAQGTAFTYQGRLNDGLNTATGIYDLRFGLWNSPDTGNSTQLGVVTNTATAVTNGLFTVTLDFGNVWTGANRWLELAVRTNGAVGFNTLAPRQFVAPTPYAIYADSVPATGLRGFLHGSRITPGTLGAVQMSNSVSLWNRLGSDIHYTNGRVGIGTANPQRSLEIGDATVGGSEGLIRLGSSSGLGANRTWDIGVPQTGEDLDGVGYSFVIDDLLQGPGPEFIVRWNTGNVGIGTITPATRLEVAGTVTATSYLGDGSGLTGINASQLITGTIPAAALGNAWRVGGNAGTTPGTQFLGTLDNQPLEFKVNSERALRLQSSASGPSLIGGWRLNTIAAGTRGAIIAGGGEDFLFNEITGSAHLSAIGGGRGNAVSGRYSVIGGGDRNSNSGEYAVIPGGANNATAAGAHYAFAAGRRAKASHPGAFVWADSTDADFASTAAQQFSVRAQGGVRLETAGAGLTVDGHVGIGTATPASPLTVRSPGFGIEHTDGAVRIGTYVQADAAYFGTISSHPLKFMVNDGSGSMTVNTDGNVGIGTGAPATKLHLAGSSDTELSVQSTDNNRRWTIQASGGADGVGLGGTFQIVDRTAIASRLKIETSGNVTIPGEVTTTALNLSSDRNVKEDFKPVNAREILAKVAALSITEWQYKSQGDARHIGPMAQDFRAAFGTGRDDKHITSVDADGVALAAIQGLNEKLEETRAENLALKQMVLELKALVNEVARQKDGGVK